MIAVRRQWHRGELGSVKKRGRIRDLLIRVRCCWFCRSSPGGGARRGPMIFVLVSRAGTPIDEHNIAARRLKNIAAELGMPGFHGTPSGALTRRSPSTPAWTSAIAWP